MYLVYDTSKGQSYSTHLTKYLGKLVIPDNDKVPIVSIRGEGLIDFNGSRVTAGQTFYSPAADSGLYVTELQIDGHTISVNCYNKPGNSSSNRSWAILSGVDQGVKIPTFIFTSLQQYYRNKPASQGAQLVLAQINVAQFNETAEMYYLIAKFEESDNVITYRYEPVSGFTQSNGFDTKSNILYPTGFDSSTYDQKFAEQTQVNQTVERQIQGLDKRMSTLETSSLARFVSR